MDRKLAYFASAVFLLGVAFIFARMLLGLINEQATQRRTKAPMFLFYCVWAASIVTLIVSLVFSIDFPVATPIGIWEFWQIPGAIALVSFFASWFLPRAF